MASSRPTSITSPSSVFDETNTNGSKNTAQKKDAASIRSSNQEKLPVKNLINAHSSSSSIDSAGAKNQILNEKVSLAQINSTATISSTTTDSESESEQEDDNNLSESNNLPRQNQQDKQLSRRNSRKQKSEINTQEQVSRRVKHFQKLFKSEIIDDMPELIDSYVCAYQGDILLQGKMYITDRYLCFHSRIISYVTKHVYRWEQIENVTKERVAFIFPTAVGIQLKQSGKKIIYASFLQRDQAFDKIISICSRFNNDTNSYQDDEESRLTPSGTLKRINNYHDKTKKIKRDMNYEIHDDLEQDNVLQMCLGQDRTNNNNRRPQSVSSKSSEDKQHTKKLSNSDKKKSSTKYPTITHSLPNDFNGNISDSNQINNQQQRNDTTSRNYSPIHHQAHHSSSRSHRSVSRDRSSLPLPRSLTPQSHSDSIPNMDSSIINSPNDGLIKIYFRTIVLSIISLIKLFIEYLLLLYNQFKTYPIKTSLILLIFIIILIFHSFYLIKLAYRIENRLQSLHHMWPSSSSSSMKRSLPSLKEL